MSTSILYLVVENDCEHTSAGVEQDEIKNFDKAENQCLY